MGLFSKSEASSSGSSSRNTYAEGRSTQVAAGKQPMLTKAPPSPYRPLYLMVWSSATFKAHWSLWAPELGQRQAAKGKRAHVIGDLRRGFLVEFIRNYDLFETRTRPTIIEIGAMRVEDLLDTPLDGQYSKEAMPRDYFENIALSVPPPRGSLNRVEDQPCSADAGHQQDVPPQVSISIFEMSYSEVRQRPKVVTSPFKSVTDAKLRTGAHHAESPFKIVSIGSDRSLKP